MPDDETKRPQEDRIRATNVPRATHQQRSILAVPAPLKRLFDRFPLVTYDSNSLPQRAPSTRSREEHGLHVFTTEQDALHGKPSYNPACLKWQTYLKFSSVPFHPVPSSNHASPSGMLPFLQPAESDPLSGVSVDPIPSNRLKKWLASQSLVQDVEETADVRYEAYVSLLDHRVRNAWLCQLYLSPQNAALAHELYVTPCSSQPLVQFAIARQLRSAARAELIKSTGSHVISASDLIRDAGEAFEALSFLLGSDDWFFGQENACLFDASVFAYTHLLLDHRLQWSHNPLQKLLLRHESLVQHHLRILRMYY